MHFLNLTHSKAKTSRLGRWWKAWRTRRDAPEQKRWGAAGDNQYEFYGHHLMANYVGCDQKALLDNAALKTALESAIKAAGATLLDRVEYAFAPTGMTAVMLLSESHASIHTYPEHQACFVDLFTCGRSCNAQKFDEALTEYLRPQRVQRRIMLRHDEGIEDASLIDAECWAAEWAAC